VPSDLDQSERWPVCADCEERHVPGYRCWAQRERLVAEEAVAERDRYGEALRQIAMGEVPGVTFAEDDLISQFAQEALNG